MNNSVDLEARVRQTLTTVAELPAGTVEQDVRRSRHYKVISRPRAFVPAIIALAGATVATVLVVVSGSNTRLLDQRGARLIVESSQMALTSGTADLEVRQSSSQGPMMSWSVDMAFSGPDISETVAVSTPPPPQASAPATRTTYGLVLVKGILYRQIVGQWYAEQATGAPNVLAAPTPRAFLNAVQPSAGLVSLGTDKQSGWTHLRARNPAAAAGALQHQVLGFGPGSITSLDLWVDASHVVHRMTWNIHYPGGCPGHMSVPKDVTVVCPPPSNDSVDITFAHIGEPQAIQAPHGALPGSGPFDEPTS